MAGGDSIVSHQTGKVVLQQVWGAAESQGEDITLQPLWAHSTGLWWEPPQQPSGGSRLADLPDPCDITSFGWENFVEKAKVTLRLVLIICF